MSVKPGSPLVLASASPRRRDLLARAGVVFSLAPAALDESPLPNEAPHALARRLAEAKAQHIANQLGRSPRRWVLGGDTLVVLGDEVLGKPSSQPHAVSMLSRLLGRSHRVVTGVALVASDTRIATTLSVESRVTMHAANPADVRAYVATREPLDCAGAYAFQGEGRRFVAKVEGSETNVIGLPLDETLGLLRDAGVRWDRHA